MFLGKMGKGHEEWTLWSVCSPQSWSYIWRSSPPFLTWPVAHSLWHAGQIRSFPSPEQSVARELWRKSTGGPLCLSSLHTTPFRSENDSTASLNQIFSPLRTTSGIDTRGYNVLFPENRKLEKIKMSMPLL